MTSVTKRTPLQYRQTASGIARRIKFELFGVELRSQFSDSAVHAHANADLDWRLVNEHCGRTGENPIMSESQFAVYVSTLRSLYSRELPDVFATLVVESMPPDFR